MKNRPSSKGVKLNYLYVESKPSLVTRCRSVLSRPTPPFFPLLLKVKQILGSSFPFPLDNKKVDLPELQGEPREISKEKCRLAAEQVNSMPYLHDKLLPWGFYLAKKEELKCCVHTRTLQSFVAFWAEREGRRSWTSCCSSCMLIFLLISTVPFIFLRLKTDVFIGGLNEPIEYRDSRKLNQNCNLICPKKEKRNLDQSGYNFDVLLARLVIMAVRGVISLQPAGTPPTLPRCPRCT